MEKTRVKKIIKIKAVSNQVNLQLQPKKRVCAYCRVSTSKYEQQNSLNAQVNHYEKLIEQNNEWEFVCIYADEGRSGMKLQKRDEFLNMIRDCEDGKIDMIITKSITRFARNTIDTIETIRKLKSLGIAVFFEKEKINTLLEKSELLLSILSSLAQGESESISTNNKWSIKKRFKDGSYVISTPAYGYTKDENRELIVEESEAIIVRRIFDEYLNGKGTYLIAKALNESNILPIRKAKEWTDNTIIDILKNSIYEGDLLLQKTFTTEVLPYSRKDNLGQLPLYKIADNHEAIITREQAKAVKEIYSYRRQQMGVDGSDKYNNRYVFSSKIQCGECDSNFRRQKIYIGKPYEKVQWCCITHIKDKSRCKLTAIREDIIEMTFITMWNKLVTNYTDILIPLLISLKKIRVNQQQEEIEKYNNRMKELKEQSLILRRLLSKGYMESAIFIENNNKIEIELETLKQKKKQLQGSYGYKREIQQTENLIKEIEKNSNILENYEEEIFENVVEKIVIKENYIITFILKNGLELSEYYGKEEEK